MPDRGGEPLELCEVCGSPLEEGSCRNCGSGFKDGSSPVGAAPLDRRELSKVLGRSVGARAHGSYSLSMGQEKGMAPLRKGIDLLVERFSAPPEVKASVKKNAEHLAVKIMDEVGPTKAAIASVAQEFLRIGRNLAEVSTCISQVYPGMDRWRDLIVEVYPTPEGDLRVLVSGRVERIYTPVQENEITKIVRQRLFSSVDESGARGIVSEFLDYAEKEGILPAGKEVSEYRDRFLDSYPFAPEVVEVMYHRWGSFPTFQRTRGVLRLLSLVIYSLRQSSRPYITLSDFDLENTEVRRELIKHIGPEFDSVIAADITDKESGAKKIDTSIGKSFRGLLLGTRSATCIFLYSFSGGQEKGAHIGEIKRSATTTENPSSVVVEAVEQLKGKLFFLQSQNEKYFFLNQPNMNRIILTKMENIKDKDVLESEKEILGQQISSTRLKVFLWPEKPKDVPDTEELKLVVTPERDISLMRSVLESKGESPRVFRNAIFFVCPSDVERNAFLTLIKRKTAYEQVQGDKTLRLTDEQKREVANTLRKEEENLKDAVKRCYRLAYAPSKDGLKEVDLGIPTYGEKKSLDQGVYEQLKAEQEILERISPLVVREKYLGDKDFVKLRQIYDSMLRTPGERRITSAEGFEESISQGVKQGLFGLGELSKDGASVTCRYFKEDAIVEMGDTEVIVKDSICLLQKQSGEQAPIPFPVGKSDGKTGPVTVTPSQPIPARTLSHVTLEFEVPRGKVSQLMGMMSFLQSKFQDLNITVKATEGSISEEDYVNKVKETLRQLGVEFRE